MRASAEPGPMGVLSSVRWPMDPGSTLRFGREAWVCQLAKPISTRHIPTSSFVPDLESGRG